ncbi:Uncharacterized protein HZ326_3194 [Fusarium oxysporum f. sp. albedinis]|nr:Uncharacterized protein HZ326_3194 [Fusarium oxysporum f. sp. albedinis]
MTREVILPFSPKILPTTASNDEIEWSREHSFYSNWSGPVSQLGSQDHQDMKFVQGDLLRYISTQKPGTCDQQEAKLSSANHSAMSIIHTTGKAPKAKRQVISLGKPKQLQGGTHHPK